MNNERFGWRQGDAEVKLVEGAEKLPDHILKEIQAEEATKKEKK